MIFPSERSSLMFPSAFLGTRKVDLPFREILQHCNQNAYANSNKYIRLRNVLIFRRNQSLFDILIRIMSPKMVGARCDSLLFTRFAKEKHNPPKKYIDKQPTPFSCRSMEQNRNHEI